MEKREIPLLEIVHRGAAAEAAAASAASQSKEDPSRSFASRASGAYQRIRTPVYGNSTPDEASEANRSALKGALVGALVGGLASMGERPSATPAQMTLGTAAAGAVAGLMDARERQRDARLGVEKSGLERVLRAVTTADVAATTVDAGILAAGGAVKTASAALSGMNRNFRRQGGRGGHAFGKSRESPKSHGLIPDVASTMKLKRLTLHANKAHQIFVLAPLSHDVESRLRAMILPGQAGQTGQTGQTDRRTDVYVRAFSESALDLYAPVCASGDSDGAALPAKATCRGDLPAHVNQYCSDDPLALVRLIAASQKAKTNTTFRIFPTQLTKNAAFDSTVRAELKRLLVASWPNVAVHMRRKIVAWCTDKRPATANELGLMMHTQPKDLVIKPLQDPFVAFVAHTRTKSDTKSKSHHKFQYRYKTAPVDVFEDPVTRMPRMRRTGEPTGEPMGEPTRESRRVVAIYHASEDDARKDAAAYAQYVVGALTSSIDGTSDSDATSEISIIENWAAWDTCIAVRCILHSLSGPATVYCVGRPVESATCGELDLAARWDGARVGGRVPTWPPCTYIDKRKSDEEAVNVAATWTITLGHWLEDAETNKAKANKITAIETKLKQLSLLQRKPTGKRTIHVVNCGYPLRHGANPALHTPIVDIFTVYDSTATRAEYLPLPSYHLETRGTLRDTLERGMPANVADYARRPRPD